MQKIRCQVKQVQALNDAVYHVILTPETPMNHQAGQYLMILMSEEDKRAFSIASPAQSTDIELHIGASVAESYAMQVIERLQNESHIDVLAPSGNAQLRHESKRPRLMIAGGTGFSYIHSLLSEQIRLGQQVKTTVYWGAKTAKDLYLLEQMQTWAQAHDWLNFIPVVEQADSDWTGQQNNVLAQIKADFISVNGYDIYVAGRFAMVGAAREMLREMSLEEAHLYGDALAFIK